MMVNNNNSNTNTSSNNNNNALSANNLPLERDRHYNHHHHHHNYQTNNNNNGINASDSATSVRIIHNKPLKKSTNRLLIQSDLLGNQTNNGQNSRPSSNSSVNSNEYITQSNHSLTRQQPLPQQQQIYQTRYNYSDESTEHDDDDVIPIDECDKNTSENNNKRDNIETKPKLAQKTIKSNVGVLINDLITEEYNNNCAKPELMQVESQRRSQNQQQQKQLQQQQQQHQQQQQQQQNIIKNPDENRINDTNINDLDTGPDIFDTDCPICKKSFISRNPKMLSCLHTYCECCLNSLIKNKTNETKSVYVCQICKQESDIECLIDNLFTYDIKSPLITDDEKNKGDFDEIKSIKVDNLKCTNCDENNAADWFCTNCSEWLCEECKIAHARVKLTKDHLIVHKTLVKQNNSSSSVRNNLKTSPSTCAKISKMYSSIYCSIHPKEKLSLYCETCDTLTCRDCQLSSRHKEHKYKYIDEAAQQQRVQFEMYLEKLKKRKTFLQNAYDLIDSRKMDINSKSNCIINDIKTISANLVAEISKRTNYLIDNLKYACSDKLTHLNKKSNELKTYLRKFNHCINVIDNAIKSNNETAILLSKRLIINQLNNLLNEKCEVLNPQHQFQIQFINETIKLNHLLTHIGYLLIDGRTYCKGPSGGSNANGNSNSPVSSSSNKDTKDNINNSNGLNNGVSPANSPLSHQQQQSQVHSHRRSVSPNPYARSSSNPVQSVNTSNVNSNNNVHNQNTNSTNLTSTASSSTPSLIPQYQQAPSGYYSQNSQFALQQAHATRKSINESMQKLTSNLGLSQQHINHQNNVAMSMNSYNLLAKARQQQQQMPSPHSSQQHMQQQHQFSRHAILTASQQHLTPPPLQHSQTASHHSNSPTAMQIGSSSHTNYAPIRPLPTYSHNGIISQTSHHHPHVASAPAQNPQMTSIPPQFMIQANSNRIPSMSTNKLNQTPTHVLHSTMPRLQKIAPYPSVHINEKLIENTNNINSHQAKSGSNFLTQLQMIPTNVTLAGSQIHQTKNQIPTSSPSPSSQLINNPVQVVAVPVPNTQRSSKYVPTSAPPRLPTPPTLSVQPTASPSLPQIQQVTSTTKNSVSPSTSLSSINDVTSPSTTPTSNSNSTSKQNENIHENSFTWTENLTKLVNNAINMNHAAMDKEVEFLPSPYSTEKPDDLNNNEDKNDENLVKNTSSTINDDLTCNETNIQIDQRSNSCDSNSIENANNLIMDEEKLESLYNVIFTSTIETIEPNEAESKESMSKIDSNEKLDENMQTDTEEFVVNNEKNEENDETLKNDNTSDNELKEKEKDIEDEADKIENYDSNKAIELSEDSSSKLNNNIIEDNDHLIPNDSLSSTVSTAPSVSSTLVQHQLSSSTEIISTENSASNCNIIDPIEKNELNEVKNVNDKSDSEKIDEKKSEKKDTEELLVISSDDINITDLPLLSNSISDDYSNDFCIICRNGGDLLCCDFCPRVYHLQCHVPSIHTKPEGEWRCGLCENLQNILKGKNDINENSFTGSHLNSSFSAASSSSKRKAPLGLNKWELHICERILLLLYTQSGSSPFHQPVNRSVQNYYRLIKHPMDFKTIKHKLYRGHFDHYNTMDEFIADVRLVFSNCALYNAPDTEIGKIGKDLNEKFENFLTVYLSEYATSINKNNSSTKLNLSNNEQPASNGSNTSVMSKCLSSPASFMSENSNSSNTCDSNNLHSNDQYPKPPRNKRKKHVDDLTK